MSSFSSSNGQQVFKDQLPEMLRKLADSPSQSEISSYSTIACRYCGSIFCLGVSFMVL